MTGPAHLLAPPPGVTGWVAPVCMPRFEKRGPKYGQLVGWLTTNNIATTARGRMEQSEIRRLWRQAAFLAYARFGVPKNLGRIFIQFEFQFAVGDSRYDQPNMEMTVKPITDALTPDRKVVVKKKKRGGGFTLDTQHHIGWGVVPDDSDRWVIRGQQLPKLPLLGRGDPVGGRVIVHVIPFPQPLPART